MPRIRQTPRCSHSGMPCDKCIHNQLTGAMYDHFREQGIVYEEVDPDEIKHLKTIIDVKVAASTLVNNNRGAYSRREIEVLPEVHQLAEREYTRAWALGHGNAKSATEHASALAGALEAVSIQLEIIFQRYDERQQEMANSGEPLQLLSYSQILDPYRQAVYQLPNNTCSTTKDEK